MRSGPRIFRIDLSRRGFRVVVESLGAKLYVKVYYRPHENENDKMPIDIFYCNYSYM